MGQLVGKDPGRLRKLSCGRCRTRWRYRRTGCPFCNAQEAHRLAVVAVEGDRSSADDLAANAAPFEGRLAAHGGSVEEYLRHRQGPAATTAIVDPPRTGLSREALQEIVGHGARQIVYVSCDVATLARDARRIVDAGYALGTVRAFDLFPNTPHVETLVTFTRTSR